jgi:hypothetical protein
MEFVDELDFTQEYKRFFEIQGNTLKKKFESKRINVQLLQNGDDVNPSCSVYHKNV